MRKQKKEDIEKIYIFTKNKNIIIKDYTTEQTKKLYNNYLIDFENAKLRKNITICEYDVFGELIKTYSNYNETNRDEKQLKNKKITKDFKYFRIYKGNQKILTNIQVKKPICKIDNLYFFSMASAGKYLKVSRQAVQQARNKHSLKIAEKNIQWI